MEFNAKIPIYYQIEQYIIREVITGHFDAGAQLPSVRELAPQLAVNVNTVQRAVAELVTTGLIVPQRGKGNFVTTNMEVIVNLRARIVKEQVATLYERLNALKITPSEMEFYLHQYIQEQEATNND
ncbi:GntR family transcriptional regulator [Lacticaseibacillus thailandensis]|uniref:HTH gntR-type domain-containing protein n=1 Tax=Lacticaseibacillus thailandensis DSM 22698 = JCM 13996 TaxID=1423810 RepID=A0A0R2C5A3_9LACO|nr:GntR family transcriptional regulator [Lacticaseibacillus thailandensis]KRM86506.1 hypothetical protein FD19_GL001936 [Lacticaseibacillus thailandensis DSM 22698 = JCM 13996]